MPVRPGESDRIGSGVIISVVDRFQQRAVIRGAPIIEMFREIGDGINGPCLPRADFNRADIAAVATNRICSSQVGRSRLATLVGVDRLVVTVETNLALVDCETAGVRRHRLGRAAVVL